jgi:hypothetical protein
MSPEYQSYKSAGDLEKAKKALMASLRNQSRFARDKKEYPRFLDHANTAIKYVKTFEELESLGSFANQLGNDPNGPFASKLYLAKATSKTGTPVIPEVQSQATPPAKPSTNFTRDQIIRETEAKLVDPTVDEGTKNRLREKLKVLKAKGM